MVDNFDAIFLPICSSQFSMQLFIIHHGYGDFFPIFDTPEDNRQEVKVMFRQKSEVTLIFTILKGIIECYNSYTEEIFDGFAELFVFYESVDLFLERTVFFLHFLLVVLSFFFGLLSTFFDASEKFKFFS